MIHSIIDEMDIFYSGADCLNTPPQLCQRRYRGGVLTLIRQKDGLKPYSFFSTNPADYIRKEGPSFRRLSGR